MKTLFITSLLLLMGGSQSIAGHPGADNRAEAYFAGGCFWCIEADFEKIDGVIEAVSGYSGGDTPDPTYEQVSKGKTGHRETVRVIYDPEKIDYKDLVEKFWNMTDPTDAGGSFGDRGHQYTSAIYYQTEKEKEIATQSKQEIQESGKFDKPVDTSIEPLKDFYQAEEYHQDYYKKNKISYKTYRYFSGRDSFIQDHRQVADKDNQKKEEQDMDNPEQNYTIPEKEELKEILTPLQYKVTQKEGTEPAFENKYWDNQRPGIYVDIVSGEPLFSSLDKFKSGTGWPSFTKPLEPQNIVEKDDWTLGGVRTEVRSKHADSHLGHVFEDGPPPSKMRYCINSAALKFIPKEELQEKGYTEYLSLFQ